MAITATAYGPFGLHLLKGDVDVDTATFMVSLHSSSYTPSKDHEFFSSVTNEIYGSGYTAGGATIGSVAAAYDATNDRSTLDGADVTWTALTATYRYAVIRVDTGSSATSPVVAWVDFGADQAASGIDVTLQWDATGFFRLLV